VNRQREKDRTQLGSNIEEAADLLKDRQNGSRSSSVTVVRQLLMNNGGKTREEEEEEEDRYITYVSRV